MGETTSHGSALRIDECRLCGKRGHWAKCCRKAHPPTKRSPSEKQYQMKLYQKKRSHYQGQGSHNQGHKTIDAVEYEMDSETYEPTTVITEQ